MAPAVAAAAWVGAWLGWLGPTIPGPVAAIVVLAVAVAWRSAQVRPVVVVAVAAIGVGGLGASARELPESLAGRTVSFTGRITGTPRQVQVDLGEPAAVVVPMRVDRLQVGTTVWEVDLPVRAFADSADIPGSATPGADMAARARILPKAPADTAVGLRLTTPGRVVSEAGAVAGAVTRLRQALSTATSRDHPDAAALVAGIAVGDESGQSPQLARTMQVSGLSHLTAVSGGNFIVVMGAVLLLARLRRFELPVQVAVAGCALLGYALVVGPQPSVLRAGTMAAAGLAGVLMGGRSRGLAVLSGCVTMLLLVSPDLARSLGFALSVAATAALQVLAGPADRMLRSVLPGRLALAVAVTLTAHVATAPLLLSTGAPVSWVAIPANLAAAPLVAAITVLGLLAALLGTVWASVAAVVAAPAVAMAELMVLVARSAEAVSLTPWGARLGLGLGCALLGVGTVALALRLWGPPARAPTLAVMALLLAGMLRAGGPPTGWQIVVCDVGQGTAVLVDTEAGPVLFDTGPGGGDVAGCLTSAGVTDVAAVVVSHFHADHVAGLPELLVARHVGQVLVPAGAPQSTTKSALDQVTQAGGLTPQEVSAGQRWQLGSVTATALWPPPGRRFGTDEANNGSLAVVLEWADGTRVLIPGDVEPESQAQIMRAWNAGPFDVVVMPHHGSDHQDPRFADWAHPALAVASAGEGNSYGHPAAATIAEYEAAGATVRRTDLDGAVVIGVKDGDVVLDSR